MSTTTKTALIVCDMQPDLLQSLDAPTKYALLDHIQMCLAAARQAHWPIVFTGLQFSAGYSTVNPQHKLYGALRRLHDLRPSNSSSLKFFLEGHEGSQIDPSLMKNDDSDNKSRNEYTIFRQQHLPPQDRIMSILQQHEITHAVVVGIKAGFAVQAMVQMLCDANLEVSVVQDCVQDDDPQRLQAVLQHLLPCYASLISLADMIDQAVGLDAFDYKKSTQNPIMIRTACSLGRSGHAPLFVYHLLLKNTKNVPTTTNKSYWCQVPTQLWFTSQPTFLQSTTTISSSKTYYCPLAKRIVDFCDEPQFSKVSMFVQGREYIDEKEKLWILMQYGDLVQMPETYLLPYNNNNNNNNSTKQQSSLESSTNKGGPWFVKDVNKNGGRAIQVYQEWEECVQFVEQQQQQQQQQQSAMFVVQRHIENPLLTRDGRKCHVKLYNLLHQTNDIWQLFTYSEAFLSTSPNVWSPTDLSPETQITIKRHERLCYHATTAASTEQEDEKATKTYYHSTDFYTRCQTNVARVVETAIAKRKISTRPHHNTQFEIFSADFMVDDNTSDNHPNLYLIECNFTPVLYDPEYVDYLMESEGKPVEQVLTTKGLQAYHALYKSHPDQLQVNDHDMIRDAMGIVFDNENHIKTKWDLAGTWNTTMEQSTTTTEQSSSY